MSKLAGNRAREKDIIKDILRGRDWDRLMEVLEGRRNPSRHLQSFLFDPDPLIQWRAIEAIAKFAGHLADSDLEDVRRIIRKALWLMNDESGGLLWNGPELIAAVLMEVPQLLDEYGRILGSFLSEEPFERGAHWALNHLVKMKPEIYADEKITTELKNSLGDSDPVIRIYARQILKDLDEEFDENTNDDLKLDDQEFSEYDFETGLFRKRLLKGVV